MSSDGSRELLELLKLPANPVRDWLELQSSSENVLFKREAKAPGFFQISRGIAVRPRGVVDYIFGNDKPLGPRIQAADLADDRP